MFCWLLVYTPYSFCKLQILPHITSSRTHYHLSTTQLHWFRRLLKSIPAVNRMGLPVKTASFCEWLTNIIDQWVFTSFADCMYNMSHDRCICFVVVQVFLLLWLNYQFIINSYEIFTHILQGYFTCLSDSEVTHWQKHYSDVITGRWRLKSSASPLFTQPFI